MGFYFSHGLTVVDLLATGRAFVKIQPWDRIGLSMKLAGPLPPDPLNLVAPTGRTFGDREHGFGLSEGLLG